MTADNEPPRLGLSLEEAFKRWGDPATYSLWHEHQDAWQHVSMAEGYPPNERVLRHQTYAKAVTALQAQLRALLIEGEVLASGIGKGSDGRSVIKPSMWNVLEFSDEFDDLLGGGRTFAAPEYFPWSAIPHNVEEHPKWLAEFLQKKTRKGPPAFVHATDYRRVRLGDLEFVFGDLQAQVVRRLREAARSSEPWLFGKAVLHEIGSESANIGMLFKRQRNWKSLIESDRRGRYRLRPHSL